MRTTDVGVHEEYPGDAAETGAQPPTDDPVERAAIQAAKAARKALRAQRQAERARRLADEYARIAAEGAPESPSDTSPAAADTQPAAAGARSEFPEEDDGTGRAGEPSGADADADADADAGTAAGVAVDADPRGGRPSGGKLLIGVAAALVACLAFAVIALVVHLSAGSGASGSAAMRDAALLAARQDIVVLNTLDYRRVDSGLQRWSDASTGALHAQLARVSSDERKRIAAAQTVTTAKVLDAAVVNLDTATGSAMVIASVELTVHPAGKPAQLKRERLRAQLVRIGDTWKVSSLDQVGVTLS